MRQEGRSSREPLPFQNNHYTRQMRHLVDSALTRTSAFHADVKTAAPELQFLVELGYQIQHSPKSIRYFKWVNSTLREVVIRSQSMERFMCEISQVKRGSVNGVKSKAITSSTLEECVQFIRSVHA